MEPRYPDLNPPSVPKYKVPFQFEFVFRISGAIRVRRSSLRHCAEILNFRGIVRKIIHDRNLKMIIRMKRLLYVSLLTLVGGGIALKDPPRYFFFLRSCNIAALEGIDHDALFLYR